jgi:hypothetical protein
MVGRRTRGQSGGEPKRATFSELAFNTNATLHHFHETPRDGQAKPGSTVFPSDRPISLGKSLKQMFLHIGRQANAGIGNGKVQAMFSFLTF